MFYLSSKGKESKLWTSLLPSPMPGKWSGEGATEDPRTRANFDPGLGGKTSKPGFSSPEPYWSLHMFALLWRQNAALGIAEPSVFIFEGGDFSLLAASDTESCKGGRTSNLVWEYFGKTSAPLKKTRRFPCKRKSCNETLREGRCEIMKRHPLTKCPQATKEVQEQLQEQVNANIIDLEEPKAVPRKYQKLEAGQAPRTLTPRKLGQQTGKLVRSIVMDGMSFQVLESLWSLDFLHSLLPGYKVPVQQPWHTLASHPCKADRTFGQETIGLTLCICLSGQYTARNWYLQEEFARAGEALLVKLKDKYDAAVALAGQTD